MSVRIFRLLGLAVLALASLPAASQQSSATAQSPVYHIELIVFRATTALGGAENWSAAAAPRSTGAMAEPADAPGDSTQAARLVGTLPASQLQLAEIETKLRASPAYAPVAHVAWAQTASPWGTRIGFPLERLGIDVPGLRGVIYLERGQFLHLGMSLSYAMPDPPAGLGAGPGTAFTLNESRRVRFYERNYFDHPAFGVIALVTPARGARAAGR